MTIRPEDRLRRKAQRFRDWVQMRVPPGVRFFLGVGLVVMGLFGFLPVLGFWMIPLGVAIAMLDLRPVWRWLKGRITRH